MQNHKPTLLYAEFYITNVCNYTCGNCNRFNNYNLKGFQKWQDYKVAYANFADRLDIKTIAILGGEPFLNPELYNWVHGVAELWPNAIIEITTNGSRRKDTQLLEVLQKYKGRVWIHLSCHDINYWDTMHQDIMNFLPDCNYEIEFDITKWNTNYNIIKGEDWPDQVVDITNPTNHEWISDELDGIGSNLKNFYQQILYKVDGEIWYKLAKSWWFNNTALKERADGSLYVDSTSDPDLAHDVCYSKTCHHFIAGELYKCNIPYSLPTAIDQLKNIDISAEDYIILNSYKPLSHDCNDTEFNNFIDNINNPIEQCKFCPTSFTAEQIFIGVKSSTDNS